MHLAAQNGHILIVRFLIDQAATAGITNSEGKTACDLAKDSLKKNEPKRKADKQKELADKGSLYSKLTSIVDFLSERAGQNQNQEQARPNTSKSSAAARPSTT